jgi:tRNA1(Val) A37 N6-methylase TrmN6
VRVLQPASGPRFTTDPILLADFVIRSCGIRPRLACDAGAGTGVLGLALAALDRNVRVSGLEIQPHLAAMAGRSAVLSGLASRVEVQAVDVRVAPVPRGGYDLIVANPPYFADAGELPSQRALALAHHEVSLTLEELVAAARRLAAPRGRLALVYPAERLQELLAALAAGRFRMRTLRLVHPRAGRKAARLLALAQLGVRARLSVLAPLVLHEGAGWSTEAAAILDGRATA